MLFGGIAWVLAIIILIPIRRRKRARDLKERVKKAREGILADGKVEGPKGPYVPHKKWNAGTPHATDAPKGNAYHGGPWPE